MDRWLNLGHSGLRNSLLNVLTPRWRQGSTERSASYSATSTIVKPLRESFQKNRSIDATLATPSIHLLIALRSHLVVRLSISAGCSPDQKAPWRFSLRLRWLAPRFLRERAHSSAHIVPRSMRRSGPISWRYNMLRARAS